MSKVLLQVAVKALIVNDEGKVLILREAPTYGEGSQHGRYEVPGGRVEPGEPYDQALRREVREEAGLDVEILHAIHAGEWRPMIKGTQHQIVGVFFVCKPKGTQAVTLSSEHDQYKWIVPSSYKRYDLLPPDDVAVLRLSQSQQAGRVIDIDL